MILEVDEQRKDAYEEALKLIRTGVPLRKTQAAIGNNPVVNELKKLHRDTARPRSQTELGEILKKFRGFLFTNN